MPLTINQVLKGTTDEQNLEFLLDALESLGFVKTSWFVGSVQRNILQAMARGMTWSSDIVKAIVTNVLVKPVGEWLDFTGIYRYGIERLAASRAKRLVTFTVDAAGSAQNISGGTIVAADGVRFKTTNTIAINVPAGSSIDIEVEAEFPGVDGNLPASTTVTIQSPTYPLTTVAFNGDPTSDGTDEESDDRYWTRCQLRWAELTYSSGLRAYELWALTAAPSVDRVKAWNNYPNENDVRIVLDPGTSGEIADVEAYIVDKHPPNDVVTVSAATVVTQQITFSPRIYKGTTNDDLKSAVNAMLDAMPIGGDMLTGAAAGRLLREKIQEALLCDAGVQTTNLTVPAADIVLSKTDIVQATYTIESEIIT